MGSFREVIGLKKIFVSVFVLTILDAVATIAGVKSGWVEEGNPFVQSAMTNRPILTGLIVCLLIGAVLCGVYRVRYKVRWLAYAMGGVLMIKLGIMALHINWITQVMKAL